ncbi:MAG: hypothetical protein WCK59_01295 [Candidatus Falkowbacteria bacterium]
MLPLSRQKIITEATNILADIFKKYHDRGIEAIYLWGSVLSSKDFNQISSDIDSIAIVKDSLDFAVEKELNDYIKIQNKGIDLKIRFLYISELNGGPSKGFTTKYINYKILLFDLKFWHHVVGQKYSEKDFSLKKITNNEVAILKLKEISKLHLPARTYPYTDYKYFLKALARFCYFIQGASCTFSYNDTLNSADKECQFIMKKIIKIKENDWDLKMFTKELPIFINFLNKKEFELTCRNDVL